uniref:hypothetical protein n=1 Tax=Sphingomonas nostoxanthinifaciens TaxID=2872652 RepID=UPI002954D55A|nr:hypothetical protein [Sphingomonas nostoxanthinifaciens]
MNPEGPGGDHDPIGAAADIRHAFGKAHGAHPQKECLGAEPTAAPIEHQGMGWTNKCGKGNAEDTITSGLEGAWSADPTHFTMQYVNNLLTMIG